MQKCERCQTRDARVRLDSLVDGHREQHYYCRQCAEELLAQANGGPSGDSLGGMFGSLFNNSGVFGANGGGFGLGAGNAGRPGSTATAQREPNKHSKTPVIDQYGRDLTQEAREGKLDPAAGREREIKRVLTVLGRRQKNNPVLIGEPGVGKTAIVEGIARRIAENNVPTTLRDARIVAEIGRAHV